MDKLIGGRIMTDRYVDTERERKKNGEKKNGSVHMFYCSGPSSHFKKAFMLAMTNGWPAKVPMTSL